MNENQNEYVDINAHDNYPDSEQKIEIPTMKVIPLKKICMTIGALPTSYLDTLSYYEMLVWFIEFLKNNIIPTINNNASAIQEVQSVVLALQNYINDYKDSIDSDVEELEEYMNNYFENLDVQDEINNKLDQMLEDGVLTEIIQQFLQSTAIWCFDNVADMKQATNLINGSFAKTLGYYEINDGGEATYKITNTASETEYQEELENGLFATLIIDNDSVNVHQFGAKGDGETDDQNAINTALSLNVTKINFGHNKTYMVRGYEDNQGEGSPAIFTTTGLVIPSNKIINLNESTVKCITNNKQNYNIFTLANVSNIILKNGFIIGDRQTHTGTSGEWGYGVALRNADNIKLENLIISECWGDGINIDHNGNPTTMNTNVYINECICDGNRRQGMSIGNGENIYITKSQFINTGNNSKYTNPGAGVDIEPSINTSYLNNVIFENCDFINNYGCGLLIFGSSVSKVKVNNCNILNNNENGSNSSFGILNSSDIQISNSIFSRNNQLVTLNIKPATSVSFYNNKITNGFVPINCSLLTNQQIIFENNEFYNDIDIAYNAVIDLISLTNPTSSKNILLVKNNVFKTTPSTNISAWISDRATSTVEKLIVEDNIFKYGKKVITTGYGCIIKNNNIIASANFAIQLAGDSTNVFIIDGNIFEEISYDTNNGGIIYNITNNNIVLQNNLLFKNCLIPSDQQEKTYSPNRFLITANPTGSSLDENNNILDNTFE